MYENPVLEFLSLSGPKLMIPFHLIIIGSLLYFGIEYFGSKTSYPVIIMWFTGGLLFWTFTEYIMHRFVFHLESNNKIMNAVHFALHGYHHDNPNDANRLFMPPLPAVLILSLFFGLFYLVMGTKAFYFLPGFEFGYLIYSYVHYCIHTRKAPKYLEQLWHHHIHHHYKDPERGFGVSSRFWDRMFRTLPED